MKLGCVPYLNAKPLVAYLDYPLEFYPPSRLESLVLEGKLDMALMSSISFLEHPGLLPFFEGGIIASDGEVESVCVFYKRELKSPQNITSIHYTSESRTSVALFKVLWSRAWHLPLSQLTVETKDPDALLIIGDRALTFEDPAYLKLDLGALWKDWTSHPFVYALWATRVPVPDAMIRLFKESLSLGLSCKEALAALDRNPERALRYLTKSIRYEMNEDSLMGLRLFQRHCFDLGLITHQRPLSLVAANL